MAQLPPYSRPPGAELPRRTTAQRGYGTLHQRLRLELLRLYPTCQRCGTDWSYAAHHLQYPATCLAHYEALCKACHAAEHGKHGQHH